MLDLNNTLLSALGIEMITIEKDYVKATMPVDERTVQPFGILHGGASVALAESVASIGAFANIDPEKQICVGLEINANHIKSAREGFVTAIGKPIHSGKTTMVWEIKIHDEKENLICISRCTIAIVDKKG
ncbi:hotdog fold thioesterase [Bacillus carboniphilus]|uniref:Hotdog fold thioesterase n=1 Tax=Bacillus carboniphilus TaxID=86663 RepID=A0ABY9JVE0_9BACI|nr:hotdog fold thioesterase [Bacillus carboniphilus]WLR42764.1 hotdog fold thioesterase [Bacillus carboniphilus]